MPGAEVRPAGAIRGRQASPSPTHHVVQRDLHSSRVTLPGDDQQLGVGGGHGAVAKVGPVEAPAGRLPALKRRLLGCGQCQELRQRAILAPDWLRKSSQPSRS